MALLIVQWTAVEATSPAAQDLHGHIDEYDRVMAEERRVAVLVEPERVYGSD